MFLHPGAKLAQKVDINGALYRSVSTSHGEEAAATVITACRRIQHLRAALHEPPTTHATNKAIKLYHQTIATLLDSAKLQPQLTVPLLWVSAFDADTHVAIADLRFDRLSTLFNLAVNEASLAAAAYHKRRTDNTALRTATKHFQFAAGYFHHAGEQPTPGGVRAITCDVYPQTLRALEYAMLGNAQQTFYLLCVENGTSESLLARFAIGARDFYDVAAETCRDPDIVNTRVNALVGVPSAALSAYFDAVAESASAAAARTAHNVSQELGRLPRAAIRIAKARTYCDKLDTTTLAAIRTLKEDLHAAITALHDDVAQRTQVAEEENRRFYFDSVAAVLPGIGCHQSVRAADVAAELAGGGDEDALSEFSHLPEVTDVDIAALARRYVDLANSLVASEVARLNTTASNVRHACQSADSAMAAAQAQRQAHAQANDTLHITAAAASATSSRAVPSVGSSLTEEEEVAVSNIQYAQHNGGTTRLRDQQAHVLKQAQRIRQDIDEIEDMLAKEDAQDRQLKNRAANRRTSSHELTYQYRSKLTKLRTNLEQAANADAMVSNELDRHINAIESMVHMDIAAAVQARLHLSPVSPSLSAPSPSSSAGIRQLDIAKLDSMVERLSECKQSSEAVLSHKDGLIESLQKKKELDNAQKATSSITDDEDEGEQMAAALEATYSDLKDQSRALCFEMNALTQDLNTKSGELRRFFERAGDEATAAVAREREREREGERERSEQMLLIFKHQAAAMKFKEALTHLEQGIHFYTKEQENVLMLRHDVNDFIVARNTEFNDLMAHINSGGNGPNRGLAVNPYSSGGFHSTQQHPNVNNHHAHAQHSTSAWDHHHHGPPPPHGSSSYGSASYGHGPYSGHSGHQ